MSQRTIRFKDDVEREIEARARSEGRSFAGWVKRAVEKALGNGASLDDASVPLPMRTPAPSRQRVTHSQRTPPRPPQPVATKPLVEDPPETDEPPMTGLETIVENMEASGNAVHSMPEESTGCAECGGDIAVHPEFGRYCTGCGARVR